MAATKVGIAVTCGTCGLEKAPHGRSVSPLRKHCEQPYGVAGGHVGCTGYHQEPLPGCLFPGETDEDFGYPCCDHATKLTERAAEAPAANECSDSPKGEADAR